ncbi:MAG: hypothetical protein K0R38_2677 [Polyangiaceae bacterium]|jgi:hypothetical protein|nr:hypothetical protein [Polyangiaceae bacterium]
MLKQATRQLYLTALETAIDRGPSADPLQVAGVALDRTVASATALVEESTLLLVAGFAFSGPRRALPRSGAQTAVLDNELGSTFARELLLRRGLNRLQPHGVLFAEHAPFVNTLRIARSFVLGEGLRHVLWVVVDAGKWVVRPRESARSHDGDPTIGAAAGLLTCEAENGIGILGIKRVAGPNPSARAALDVIAGLGAEPCVIGLRTARGAGRIGAAPSWTSGLEHGSVAERVKRLNAWAAPTDLECTPLAAVCEGAADVLEVATFEHPDRWRVRARQHFVGDEGGSR